MLVTVHNSRSYQGTMITFVRVSRCYESLLHNKNPFTLLFPDDQTRVVLPKMEGDPHSDYVNANYITVSRTDSYIYRCYYTKTL